MRRLRLFTPARWAADAPVLGTRADVVRHLAQALADASAVIEGEPGRRLPVLQPDLLVVDQLAVTGDDLLRAVETAGPAGSPGPVVGAAVGHLLLHRWHVLGDEPPVSLGGGAVLRRGSAICAGN